MSNTTFSPLLTGLSDAVVFLNAKSKIGAFSGSASSSSVAGLPDCGAPVPSPSTTLSAGESTKPPASLFASLSGLESLSLFVWFVPLSSSTELISAMLI